MVGDNSTDKFCGGEVPFSELNLIIYLSFSQIILQEFILFCYNSNLNCHLASKLLTISNTGNNFQYMTSKKKSILLLQMANSGKNNQEDQISSCWKKI